MSETEGFSTHVEAHDGWAKVSVQVPRLASSRLMIEVNLVDANGEFLSGGGGHFGAVEESVELVFFDPDMVETASIQTPTKYVVKDSERIVFFLKLSVFGSELTPTVCAIKVANKGQGEVEVESIEQREAVTQLEQDIQHSRNAFLANSGQQNSGAVDSIQSESSSQPKSRYFSNLTVRGYRGFSDSASLELARPNGQNGSGLTILVGANNSGKSTFLEALHYITRSRHNQTVTFAQPRRNQLHEEVELVLTCDDGAGFAVRSVRKGGSQAVGEWIGDEFLAGVIPDVHLTPARRVFNPYFSQHGNDDKNWAQFEAEFSRTMPRDGFVARLQAVDRDPVRKQKFDSVLEEVMGEWLEWTIDEMGENQQFLKLNGKGGWHTSEGLGEGLISLLFIVDALYDSEPGSLVAVDEPEMSLHPQLVRRLRRVLSRFAADRQIVIATHSPLLIDWVDIRAGATIARVYKENHSGSSRVAQASAKTLQDVARLADDRNRVTPHAVGSIAREAFFVEDGVIITEGQDDVAYYPIVLEDLGLENPNSFYGWGAGGANNAPKLVQLFLELGFKRLGVILDSDQADLVKKLNEMSPLVCARTIPAPDVRFKKKTPEKPPVLGLLDDRNERVRPEYRLRAAEAIKSVLEHVGNR